MWPFLFTTGSPSDNPARWWLLVVFVIALTGFVAWERHYAASGKHPLVPLALFGVISYRNGTLLAAAYFAAHAVDVPAHDALPAARPRPRAGVRGHGDDRVRARERRHVVARRPAREPVGRPLVVGGLATVSSASALLLLAAL